MYDDAGETRNATASAISAGRPARWSGTRLTICVRTRAGIASVISVATKPGATALTRTRGAPGRPPRPGGGAGAELRGPPPGGLRLRHGGGNNPGPPRIARGGGRDQNRGPPRQADQAALRHDVVELADIAELRTRAEVHH